MIPPSRPQLAFERAVGMRRDARGGPEKATYPPRGTELSLFSNLFRRIRLLLPFATSTIAEAPPLLSAQGAFMGASNILEDDSFLAGGIFISNRATKKECFSRKLFGLPSVQASFVKKIKMGMILFLFEYEERKLYGVFEATSDGAMDIVPMAFSSSGKLFSAQVSFRIIWRCPPLTEGEFFDAIKENYFAPKKFHLHLSGKQVCKLLELFDSQKRCNRDYKFITELTHSRKNGGKRYQNFRSGKHEPNKESSTDLHMYSELPDTILDQFTYHNRSLQNVDNANVGMEAALQPPFSPLEQPVLPEMVNSAPRSLHALRGNIPVNPEDGSFYQQVHRMCLKRSSISSGMNNASLDQLAYSVGSLDSHPSSRFQNYHSYPDEDMLSIGGRSNLQDESSYSLPALASKDTREILSINNLQDSIGRNFQNRVSITNSQNSCHSSSPRFNDHCAPDISSLSQRNYTKHHLDVAKSLPSPANIELFAYGHCATTSQFDENSRGSRYFRIEPHEIIPSPEYEPNNLETIESSFCSNPEKALLPVPYSSGGSKYQNELSSYSHLHEDDEYYTAATSSKYHSEGQKRTSVFLRLSELKKAPAKKVERYNPDIDVSLDELVGHISSKQKYWCRMTEVPSFNKPTKRKVPEFKRTKLFPVFKNVKEASDQFVMCDDDEQLENMCQLASEPVVLSDREQSWSQKGTDGAVLPFLNFKRRSDAQSKTCGTEPSDSGELGEKVSLVKHKRRKLLRPSFGEEDASNKVDVVQNVMEETRDLFLKEDADSNECVDTTMGKGNKIHRSSCGVSGASQEHLTREVQDTLSENVRPASALQTDLSFEGTIFIKDEKKFHNVQETSKNLHGRSLLVVDGNNSGGDKCDTEGGQKMDMVLSHASHNDNAKTYAINIVSGGQCNFQNMESPSEHSHVGPLFVKVGDSIGGIEQGGTSLITGSGSESRHKPKYSGECKSCSCYSEVFSKRRACQTSASAAQDSESGELSSNPCLGHGEATEKSEEGNIGERLHLADCDWKNTIDPHGSMSKTQEQDPSMKVHSTESDSDITGDSQCNLFKTAVEVGGPLSSITYDLYSAEASRDAEVKVGAERDQGFDDGGGIRVGFCGKKPFQVVNNEMKASHQDLLSATEDIQTTAKLSEPCTVQTGKRTANTVVVDKDNVKFSCGLIRQVESLPSGEAAESTSKVTMKLDS